MVKHVMFQKSFTIHKVLSLLTGEGHCHMHVYEFFGKS